MHFWRSHINPCFVTMKSNETKKKYRLFKTKNEDEYHPLILLKWSELLHNRWVKKNQLFLHRPMCKFHKPSHRNFKCITASFKKIRFIYLWKLFEIILLEKLNYPYKNQSWVRTKKFFKSSEFELRRCRCILRKSNDKKWLYSQQVRLRDGKKWIFVVELKNFTFVDFFYSNVICLKLFERSASKLDFWRVK